MIERIFIMGKVIILTPENGSYKAEAAEVENKDFLSFLYEKIDCRTVDVVATKKGDIWVDDEGLFVGGNLINSFTVENRELQLAGNLVVTLGVDEEGNTLLFKDDDEGLIGEWLDIAKNAKTTHIVK
jgi:hypothetical protein